VDDDLGNLDAALDGLLGAGSTDPTTGTGPVVDLAAERTRLRAYYLGDFPADRYADGFLTAARAVIDASRATAGSRS
jgi:hypothetical protein